MSFGVEVQDWVDRSIEEIDIIRRKTVIDLFSKIVKKTPADTGRARGNWQVSTGAPLTSVIDRLDKSGQVVQSEIKFIALQSKLADVFIANSLPYIMMLEYGGYGDGPKTVGGFSKQAPKGMVRISIASFKQIVSDKAGEEGWND